MKSEAQRYSTKWYNTPLLKPRPMNMAYIQPNKSSHDNNMHTLSIF